MFQIIQGRDGKYYWHLRGHNGEIICASEGYTTMQAAQAGINACCRVVINIMQRG